MEVNKKVIGEVIDSISKRFDDELYKKTSSGLEDYWHFKWVESKSDVWNTYEFNSMLNIYSSFCRRWEEHHNGPCCVVERVRDKYLMPKIKLFVEKITKKGNHG